MAPFNGIVIGMTSVPAVARGEPVFHLAELPSDAPMQGLRDQRSGGPDLAERLTDDLGTNVHLVDPKKNPSRPEITLRPRHGAKWSFR